MRFSAKIKLPKSLENPATLGDEISVPDSKFIAQAERVSDLAKEFITTGNSPILGFGRYQGYAKQRNQDPTAYPANRKPARPVNLTLSGEMLSYYKSVGVSLANSLAIKIGLVDAPQKVRDRAKGNNLGVPERNIPARRFIPQKGEKFNVTIEKQINTVLQERIARAVKKIFGK